VLHDLMPSIPDASVAITKGRVMSVKDQIRRPEEKG
jgi:hypothetical protein